ncbi:hypothetical protein [Halalkalibacter okhensis]|uniref:Uncharacterized protein n=1 Tax=Halalkalibacter okhensis TaxID=333138 RepID=A0A0B0IDN4_9BACI|nr:hypothetical protein [Halalkalibacter okhensis]KHF38189.1 hypothetical protein LQ50_22820 [Halalkalibacter okhensis]
MAKTTCWIIIFIALAVNVVMLQWTIEAYLGLEFDLVFRNTIIALISSVVALLTMFKWRKFEYK